jgi:hypothetical protein
LMGKKAKPHVGGSSFLLGHCMRSH